MTHSVLLDNNSHANLRVITRRGSAWGDDVMSCMVFPAEFRSVQAYYPIVFQRTPSENGGEASFQPAALFGLQEGENLFLGPQGWDAHYLPLLIERQPFLIGRAGETMLMHVDMDSPRISSTEGEALFLAHGMPTEYLERMQSVLLAIHQGVQAMPAFVQALLQHNLLESFVLDVELADGSQNRLAGLFTIDEDRLAALSGDALAQLNREGHLMAIYMVLASLSKLRDLIERQHRRLAALR